MVSPPVQRAAALATMLLHACGAPQAPVIAVVQVPAGMPVTCVRVTARAAPAGVEQTGPIPAQAGGEYRVAVYPGGALGNGAISVAAEGLSGAGCSAWIAASEPAEAAFGPQATEVGLPLKDCGGPCVDGGVPDGGTPDGGSPDGGLSCGPGRDAGQACGNGGACSSAGVCVPGFRYPPSNFDPTTITTIAPAISLNCNTSFDSTTLVFGNNWCGQPRPVPVQIVQDGGVPAILLATSDLTVTASGSLALTGRWPVIFAVFGNASLLGSVLTDAGADLSPACDLARGAVGFDDTANGGAGGGGGAFGAASGAGGRGGGTATGGDGGRPAGLPELVPLIGGCPGGRGGAGIGAGGAPGAAGGGAFQCSASGTLRIAAIVGAPGQGGRRGNGGGGSGLAGGGGAGAGSGGGLLLEGQVVQVTGTALLTANGGGGGEGGGTNNTGIDGQPGSITSAAPAQGGNASPPTFPGFGGNGGTGTAAAQNGQPANTAGGGGGGGGGAVGRIRINASPAGGCDIDAGVLSPRPTGNGSPGCP